jgi:hypothetical protein
MLKKFLILQEEELKRQMQQHSFPYQSPYRSSFPQKQQVGSPVPLDNHHQQYHLSPTTVAAPPLPKSPPPALYRPPPPRVSSPEKITPPQTSPRPRSDKKTVSFNETVATNEPPPTPPPHERQEPTEKVREDPNVYKNLLKYYYFRIYLKLNLLFLEIFHGSHCNAV